MIWFTADTHFNHENIIQHCNRPFKNLGEMHETIISNWNKVVLPQDTVYHLGDFALSKGSKDAHLIDLLLSKLNGNKFLITGNHDRKEVINNRRWVKITPYHELKIDMGNIHKQRIVLFHYSMRVWNQCHRGAWMLYGHSHGNLKDIGGKTMDVGVDSHNYCPVSLNEIKDIMDKRQILVVDHHGEVK